MKKIIAIRDRESAYVLWALAQLALKLAKDLARQIKAAEEKKNG